MLADTIDVCSNIDITATMLHLAGAGPKTFDLDGRVMPWGEKGASVKELGSVSHQLSEFWLVAEEEGKWANFNMTLMRSPGCESPFFLAFL
jgi:arylsulfatase A-like enzyme